MEKLRIGVIREGKVPPDKRVPLSPQQCVEIMERWPHVEVLVQPSPIRKFQDEEYASLGIQMPEDISHCDIILGVKEVPIKDLIPGKTFLFFSHTYKKQPYNAGLLKAIIDKKIRLIDYELLKYKAGNRLIGFGRYAGIVGCYNGWRALGLKLGKYELKPANLCDDRVEMESQLKKAILPKNLKVVLTGMGRVGHGARETMSLLPIKEVNKEDFLNKTFDEPVFVHLDTEDYFKRASDLGYDQEEFYADPSNYVSVFPEYCNVADMYVACHYWADGSPHFFSKEDLKSPDWKIKVIADISCDIEIPIPTTLRPSKIADPIYGVDRFEGNETDFHNPNAVAVMAVDNLPCELPKDASEGFGRELIDKVLKLLIEGDEDDIILRATETDQGALTAKYSYLQSYVDKANY